MKEYIFASGPTPGPWKAFFVPGKTGGCGVTTGVADIAHCHGFSTSRLKAEERANAQLISASPDMLAALKEARRAMAWVTIENMMEAIPIIEQMDAAIAKAEGA